MSGKVDKILRKTAKVMNVSLNKLKSADKSLNMVEKGKIHQDLKRGLNVKR